MKQQLHVLYVQYYFLIFIQDYYVYIPYKTYQIIKFKMRKEDQVNYTQISNNEPSSTPNMWIYYLYMFIIEILSWTELFKKYKSASACTISFLSPYNTRHEISHFYFSFPSKHFSQYTHIRIVWRVSYYKIKLTNTYKKISSKNLLFSSLVLQYLCSQEQSFFFNFILFVALNPNTVGRIKSYFLKKKYSIKKNIIFKLIN